LRNSYSAEEVAPLATAEALGERKIISLIHECLDPMPNTPVPFGDDVSAIDIGNNRLVIMKTDMLVGKTDVPPNMNLWQASRKTVVMNVSDLAAKGVRPSAMLASIGIPQGYTEEDIQQIGRGLNAGAREYGTYVLGGDTNEASDLIISCALLGIGKRGFFMSRSGARKGDIAAVTGLFGKTASGLKILLEKLSAPPNVSAKILDAVLMPHARLKEGLALASSGTVTASIDSSDGLAWSLHEISRASDVGFIIENPPIAPETREFAEIHDLDPLELSLYGGEEYELVVTIKPRLWKEAERAIRQIGGDLIEIGRVIEERRLLLESEEETHPIEAKGWEHFRKS